MAWVYGRKVLALYNGKEANNAWAYLDGGIGWRKLQGDAWEASTSMAVLAAHAKSDNRFVDIDLTGVVEHLYVW